MMSTSSMPSRGVSASAICCCRGVPSSIGELTATSLGRASMGPSRPDAGAEPPVGSARPAQARSNSEAGDRSTRLPRRAVVWAGQVGWWPGLWWGGRQDSPPGCGPGSGPGSERVRSVPVSVIGRAARSPMAAPERRAAPGAGEGPVRVGASAARPARPAPGHCGDRRAGATRAGARPSGVCRGIRRRTPAVAASTAAAGMTCRSSSPATSATEARRVAPPVPLVLGAGRCRGGGSGGGGGGLAGPGPADRPQRQWCARRRGAGAESGR